MTDAIRFAQEPNAVSGLSHLRSGVSVIIPSHQGRGHIERCLRSLACQTLEPELFEIIIVLNGPPDGAGAVLERFGAAWPKLNLVRLELMESGASRARNAGIEFACREHITFVDDDDSVSPGYLKKLLDYNAPGVVPFAPIVNINEKGGIDPFNPISMQTVRYTNQRVHPEFVPRAVGFNACKLLPTHIVKGIAYDPALGSGVDVVFFMTLLAHYDFRFHVCPIDSGPDADNAVYYRLLRPRSMSRQDLSFDFNVVGRLEVISRIDALLERCDDRRRRVLRMTMSAQAGFISRYLAAHPDDLDRVLRSIEAYGINEFPYKSLNVKLAV